MIVQTLGLPQTFSCAELTADAGIPDVSHFDGCTVAVSGEPMLLRIEAAQCAPLVGAFERGSYELNGVFAWVRPLHACVVAGGAGYVIPLGAPEAFFCLAADPVKHIVSFPERGMIVVGDFQGMVAYDAKGLAWVIERLAHDGYDIESVLSSTITGYSSTPDGSQRGFTVDVQEGRLHGGWSL